MADKMANNIFQLNIDPKLVVFSFVESPLFWMVEPW